MEFDIQPDEIVDSVLAQGSFRFHHICLEGPGILGGTPIHRPHPCIDLQEAHEIEDLLDLSDRELRHREPTPRKSGNETLLFDLEDGFSNRSSTGSKLLCKLVFEKHSTGLDLAVQDGFLEDAVNLFSKRTTVQAFKHSCHG